MAQLYFVFVGKIEPYLTERDLADMGRARTVAQIAEGQFDNLHSVIEADVQAGTSRDVTDELCAEVSEQWAHDGEPLSDWKLDFVERFVGMHAARSFAREAV